MFKEKLPDIVFYTVMLSVLGGIFFLCFTGCTVSISMAHTEGAASDVIDDTQIPTTDLSPTLTIPMIGA